MKKKDLKIKSINKPFTRIEQIVKKLQQQGINAELCKRVGFRKIARLSNIE